MIEQVCRYCKRLRAQCHEPVDARFPEVAREAYELAGLTTAPKCARGQLADLKATAHGRRFGWSIERAVAHREWTGDVPDGLDVRLAHNRSPRHPVPVL